MKNTFTLSLCLLLGINFCFSQIIRFNNTYDLYGTWDHASSVIVENDGYFVTGTTAGDSGSNRKLALLKIDFNGNVVWFKNYSVPQRSFYEFAHPDVFIKSSDNCYVFSGSLTSTNGQDVVLIKFNLNGDTLWQKTYGDTLDWWGFQCQETVDKGFIIVGSQNISTTNTDLLLIKTDSVGNLKWKKNINFTQEGGYTIICTPDSGFLIGGRKANGFYDVGLIVKTDSIGNVQWQKYVYGTYDVSVINLALTKDNNFIAVGFINDSNAGSFDAGRAFILKFYSNNGQTIWQKFYGRRGVGSGLSSIKVLPDSSYIVCGTQGSGVLQGYEINGYILKIKANGDSIFSREFNKYSGSSTTDELITIVPTPDSGYIAAGDFSPYNQDMWVIKMDSFGCDTIGCQSTEVTKIYNPLKEFNIYPNPFNDIINFNFNEKNAFQIRIYDLLGKSIFSQNVSNSDKEMDLSFLPKGIYLLQIKTKNKVTYKKIIKK